jgi:hypothetical protein
MSFSTSEPNASTSSIMHAPDPNSEAPTKEDSPSIDTLNDRLEDLWVQYLALVTTYESAQKSIQAGFSKAFFNLAEANFSKGSGRRYGRDYYDQRAIASVRTTIVVEDETSGMRPHVRIVHISRQKPQVEPVQKVSTATSESSNDNTACDGSTTQKSDSDAPLTQSVARAKLSVQQLLTPEATPEPPKAETEEADASQVHPEKESSTNTSETDDSVKPTVRPTDPLRSFSGGILISPGLRRAHKSFSALFADQLGNDEGENSHDLVSTAVNAARAMRVVEVEIRRLRKSIKKAERKGN